MTLSHIQNNVGIGRHVARNAEEYAAVFKCLFACNMMVY